MFDHKGLLKQSNFRSFGIIELEAWLFCNTRKILALKYLPVNA